MLLTGHKTRAIFDRYNIINEQELLDAGDQLVAYLAQHAQAQAPRGRADPGADTDPGAGRAGAPQTAHDRMIERPRPHDTVPGFPDRLRENPPRQGFFEHPEYLAVRQIGEGLSGVLKDYLR